MQDHVVFLLDDVAHVDLQGLPLPNINRIASEGLVFTSAFANPVCWVTRRSLHYGHWWVGGGTPPCGGVLSPEDPPPGLRSLGNLHPWRSALFGKWHLQPSQLGGPSCGPIDAGYSHFLAGSASNVNNCGGSGYWDWVRYDDCTQTNSTEYEPLAVRDAFLNWWNINSSAGRLAVVSHNLAHAPFDEQIPISLLPRDYPVPTNGKERFQAMIVASDALLGQMLDAIDPNSTTVWLISDNGTPPGVGGGQRGKGTVYERGINIPFMVWGAGVKPGVSDELVHVVDIYATLGGSGDGIDLTTILNGEGGKGHDMVLCGVRDPSQDEIDGSVCARSKFYKLRRTLQGPRREQFYVLPDEQTNRISNPTLADEVARHRAWLDANLP